MAEIESTNMINIPIFYVRLPSVRQLIVCYMVIRNKTHKEREVLTDSCPWANDNFFVANYHDVDSDIPVDSRSFTTKNCLYVYPDGYAHSTCSENNDSHGWYTTANDAYHAVEKCIKPFELLERAYEIKQAMLGHKE